MVMQQPIVQGDSTGSNVENGAASGATAGSVAGPYGALIGGAAGALGGLIGSGQGESTVDLSQLYSTIQNAGAYQQQIINALPAEIQANLAQYAQTQGAAGQLFAQQMQTQGQNYLNQTKSLYGPDSAAGLAQKAANTQSIYSTVPGTTNAVRNALAATGGLQRGQAGVALAQPALQAAQTNSQANANVNAQQTQQGQAATQSALNTVNSMDASTFQALFGMSQAQAQQILTTGNQTLQNQLAQLINQSNTQTTQLLNVNGIAANNAYQNAVQQSGNQNAVYNGLLNGVAGAVTPSSGNNASSTGAGLNGQSDVTSEYYTQNAANQNPNMNW